jgi:hypothetical protein
MEVTAKESVALPQLVQSMAETEAMQTRRTSAFIESGGISKPQIYVKYNKESSVM